MNLIFITLITILTSIGTYISIKEEPDKQFIPDKRGYLIIAITLLIFIITIISNSNPVIKLGLIGLMIISIPMNVADFQCYYLPKKMSLIFEVIMIFLLPFIFNLPSGTEWLKAIGVYMIALIVLSGLALITNFGIADAYVGAWLAIPMFFIPDMMLSSLMAFVVATLILIILTYMTKGRKITHIPYVPALIWTIPLAILLI